MKLAAYLEQHDISQSDFASRIGTSQAAVARYVAGQRLPRPEHMRAITAATLGAVTANDFHDTCPDLERERASA